MSANDPSIADLRTLLVTLLAGTTGQAGERWEPLIEIEMLPLATNPRCNWMVRSIGSAREQDQIEQAAKVVRIAHPYVRSGEPDRF